MAQFGLNTTINDTGYLQLPAGTTAQRPGSPVAGMVRFNTQLNATEYYNGTYWLQLEITPKSTINGDLADRSGYGFNTVKTTIHTFNQVGIHLFLQ
jgi:hypothetical protein